MNLDESYDKQAKDALREVRANHADKLAARVKEQDETLRRVRELIADQVKYLAGGGSPDLWPLLIRISKDEARELSKLLEE